MTAGEGVVSRTIQLLPGLDERWDICEVPSVGATLVSDPNCPRGTLDHTIDLFRHDPSNGEILWPRRIGGGGFGEVYRDGTSATAFKRFYPTSLGDGADASFSTFIVNHALHYGLEQLPTNDRQWGTAIVRAAKLHAALIPNSTHHAPDFATTVWAMQYIDGDSGPTALREFSLPDEADRMNLYDKALASVGTPPPSNRYMGYDDCEYNLILAGDQSRITKIDIRTYTHELGAQALSTIA